MELNKRYLNHDYYTDIITFDYVEGKIISGDIFISVERVSDNSAQFGVNLEEEFLRVHLGTWVTEFCAAVEKHAATDFYRGLAMILDAYIRTDRKWLQSLARR